MSCKKSPGSPVLYAHSFRFSAHALSHRSMHISPAPLMTSVWHLQSCAIDSCCTHESDCRMSIAQLQPCYETYFACCVLFNRSIQHIVEMRDGGDDVILSYLLPKMEVGLQKELAAVLRVTTLPECYRAKKTTRRTCQAAKTRSEVKRAA